MRPVSTTEFALGVECVHGVSVRLVENAPNPTRYERWVFSTHQGVCAGAMRFVETNSTASTFDRPGDGRWFDCTLQSDVDVERNVHRHTHAQRAKHELLVDVSRPHTRNGEPGLRVAEWIARRLGLERRGFGLGLQRSRVRGRSGVRFRDLYGLDRDAHARCPRRKHAERHGGRQYGRRGALCRRYAGIRWHRVVHVHECDEHHRGDVDDRRDLDWQSRVPGHRYGAVGRDEGHRDE